MNLRARTSVRRRIAGAATVLLVLLGVAGSAPAAESPPGPTTTVRVPAPVDPFAAYIGQSTCDPTVKPGTLAVFKIALDFYGVGRSLGITRPCAVGGQSEHKEGRAFDWGVRVDVPAEKAAADAFTHWLTADGPDGKPGYNARRLGVMYVIWNGHIWSASIASQGWKPYNGPSPHTDHVHVSLSWSGAYQKTSWWTGSTIAQPPIGSVDAVTATRTGVTVQGWALDPDTTASTDVHVYVDGIGVSTVANRSRPDVAAAFRLGDKHGFSVTVPRPPGPHTVCVYAIDLDPRHNSGLGCRTVVATTAPPIGSLDAVTAVDGVVTVSGWSLDRDTPGPNDVHVYVGSAGVSVRADRPRPDVAAAMGTDELHGFTWSGPVAPGTHQVCAYGMNTEHGAHTLLGCRQLVVVASTAAPIGSVDVFSVTAQAVTVEGWTLDPDTIDPTQVQVVVDGVASAVVADRPRPDVAAVFGRGDRRGYLWTAQLTPGPHTVCVNAINTGPGSHTELTCRTVEVPR